jgi:hypothetical protein
MLFDLVGGQQHFGGTHCLSVQFEVNMLSVRLS